MVQLFKMLKTVVDKNKKVNMGAIRQSARSAASTAPSLQQLTTDLQKAASNLASSNTAVEQAEAAMLELIKHAKLVDPAEQAHMQHRIQEQKQKLQALMDRSNSFAAALDNVAASAPTTVPPEASGYFARLKKGVNDIYTNHGKTIATAAIILGAAAAVYYSGEPVAVLDPVLDPAPVAALVPAAIEPVSTVGQIPVNHDSGLEIYDE
jgi:hypothetical protein